MALVCISSTWPSQFLCSLCTLFCTNCPNTTFLILNYCIQKFHRSSNLLDTEVRRSLGHTSSSHGPTGEIMEQICLLQPFPTLHRGHVHTSAGDLSLLKRGGASAASVTTVLSTGWWARSLGWGCVAPSCLKRKNRQITTQATWLCRQNIAFTSANAKTEI